MRRSSFVVLGLAAFGLILATFIVRGTTRLILGDRISLLLAFPLAASSLLLVSVLVIVATADLLGVHRMEDDLTDGDES